MSRKTSVIKALYTGEVLNELIFPYPKIEQEKQETIDMLLESLDRFAKESINPSEIDENAELPQHIIDQFKELGLFGLIVPEEYDGFGFNQTMYNKVMNNLTSHDASCSLIIGAHESIGMKAILLFGNDEQKKKYLPLLATGEYIAAYALTEPGSGSDAGSIQTKAVLSEDKSHYILNGSKIWITNGGIADLFTVFAKTGDKISAFIVTRDMGVKSGTPEKKMGIKGSNTTTMFFEDVKVPVENRLGDEGQGFKVAMEVLNQGRLGLSAGCIGVSNKVLKLALDHAKKREQFKLPLIKFEMIREKIARMTASNFIMESMTYLTSGICDKKEYDYSIESAVCKVFCSEELWRNANDALQIAAGIGYMKEYPYERIVRDARINMIFEGSNEVLRAFIALQGAKHFGNEMMAGKLETIQKNTPQLKTVNNSLNDAKDIFIQGSKYLKEMIMSAVMEYQFEIVKKEYVVERIANITIDLYGILAGISKCESLIDQLGENKASHYISLLNIFSNTAKDRIQIAYNRLKDPLDDIKNTVVDNIAGNESLIG